jgi:hypothetical protein
VAPDDPPDFFTKLFHLTDRLKAPREALKPVKQGAATETRVIGGTRARWNASTANPKADAKWAGI